MTAGRPRAVRGTPPALFGAAVVIWFAVLGAGSAAQGPPPDPHAAQPERPTVATHAGTVAAGWLEIEAGAELDRYPTHEHGAAAPVLFKVGLARRLQLSVQTSVVRPPGGQATGFGDASVGVKWRLTDTAPLLARFAILPGLKLPTGETGSGTGTGTTDASLFLISSHAFGPVSMDVNVGYTWRSGQGTRASRRASVWTASFGGPARGELGWAAEIYGYPGTSGPAGSAPIVAFLGGPTLVVRPWLVLDAGVILPMTGPQARALYAGVVCNVGRIFRPPAGADWRATSRMPPEDVIRPARR